MSELNREQIIRALERDIRISLDLNYECPRITYSKLRETLSFITSQEQRIGAQDMTISELRQRAEKAEHDADRYAKRIKELTEENERLNASCTELARNMQDSVRAENEELRKSQECDLRKFRADTVRQFAERLKKYYNGYKGSSYGYVVSYHIDQIAKEMLEGIHSGSETYIACGDPIPEGRQVCPKCDKKKIEEDADEIYKQIL